MRASLVIAVACLAVVMALPLEDSTSQLVDLAETAEGGNSTNATNATVAPATPAAKPAAKPAAVKVPELIPTPAPPTPEHMARIRHYVKKIEAFQKLKNQKWEPLVTQDLAENLALVDSLDVSSPGELEMEAKLRASKNPEFSVEMSLRKYDQAAGARKAEEKAKKAKGASEVREKAQRKADLEKEDREVKKTIAKYEKLAVTPQMRKNAKKARDEYKNAAKETEKLKKTKHFKTFSKEYALNKPVDGASDYPTKKEELGEAHDHIIKGKIEKVRND